MPILHRDFETQSAAPIKKVGARRYAAAPTTRVLCICFAAGDGPVESFIPGSGAPIPQVFYTARDDPSWFVSAHNDPFESAIEEYVLARSIDFPLVPVERHICTMAMARYRGLPGELGKVAELLQLPVRKDREGARLMLELCRPRKGKDKAQLRWPEITPEKLARLVEYCKNDVAVEREIFRRLPRLPEDEHRVWCLDRKINVRGFAVDVALAARARELVQAEKAHINTKMRAVTAGAVDGFTKLNDMREFINARGHRMTKLNKRAVTAVLAHDPDDTVREVLGLRQTSSNTAVEKYNAVLAGAFPDRRIYGLLHYYGAHTGRWTSAGFNAHNLPREDSDDALAAIAAIQSGDLERVRAFGPPLDVIASVARGLVVAPPSMLLLAGDFSVLEPRVASWFAEEKWKLDTFRKFDETGNPLLDAHRVVGARMRGCPVDPADEEARQHGKTVHMALNYGGSVPVWRKFVPDDPRSDEEIKAQEIDKFRQLHPAQTQFMYNLDRQALRCVRHREPLKCKRHSFEMDGDTLILHLPNGRPLFYPKAHIRPGRFGRDVVAYHNPAHNCEDEMWYGAWLAHLVSATSRDLLVNALFNLDAAGFAIVLHVHDEIVAEVDPANVERDRERFKACMLQAPAWAEGLPLAAKVRVGPRYIKADVPIEITAPTSIEPVVSVISTEMPCDAPPLIDGGNDPPAEPAIEESEPAPANDGENIPTELPPAEPACVDAAAHAAPPLEERAAPPSESPSECQAGNASLNSAPDAAQASWTNWTNGGGNGRGTWADEDYGSGEREGGVVTATFIYRTAGGSPFMRVKKTSDKQFPTSTWINGRWEKHRPPKGTLLPYRLPELLAAPLDQLIFVPEGEKDCERLAAMGLIATCNPFGASESKDPKKSKWWPELNQHFKGRRVCILEDNDEPGRTLGEAKMRALSPIAAEVFRVSFPELPDRGDVSDWLDQLNPATARATLEARCEQARKQQGGDEGLVFTCLADTPLRAKNWLWKGRLLRDALSIVSGQAGLGKSLATCSWIASITTGRSWPDGSAGPPPGKILIITGEDSPEDYRARVQAAGGDVNRVEVLNLIKIDDKKRALLLAEDIERLERAILRRGERGYHRPADRLHVQRQEFRQLPLHRRAFAAITIVDDGAAIAHGDRDGNAPAQRRLAAEARQLHRLTGVRRRPTLRAPVHRRIHRRQANWAHHIWAGKVQSRPVGTRARLPR
jgi:AAA domain